MTDQTINDHPEPWPERAEHLEYPRWGNGWCTDCGEGWAFGAGVHCTECGAVHTRAIHRSEFPGGGVRVAPGSDRRASVTARLAAADPDGRARARRHQRWVLPLVARSL